jgi:hypothetical protein
VSNKSNGNGFMVQWEGRTLYVVPEDVERLLRGFGSVMLRPIQRLEEDRPFSAPEHVVWNAIKRAESKNKMNIGGSKNED